MILKGKCKEDFEKWYNDTHFNNKENKFDYLPITIKGFYRGHLSMQYGVYVDWFDSVGYNINIGYGIVSKEYDFELVTYRIEFVSDMLNTRQEARTKAIEKANEIYNSSK